VNATSGFAPKRDFLVDPGPDEAVALGRMLGRYELLAPIGRGGMGVVWVARLRGSRGFARNVALKVMHPALSSEPRFEQMFLAEARIASQVRHPNVCQILDLGEDQGILYLVMEWVDGDSLSTLLELAGAFDRRLSYGMAAWLAAKAARGLHAVHELADEHGQPYGVVHRDVSPHNILVTADGVVQVVDFGVAKAMAESGPATRSGYLKGKVAYLAPEQVRGEACDARVDVFALGCVLYELATGQHPFRRSTDLSTLLNLGSADAAPSPDRSDCPVEFRAILARALEKEVACRYGSMSELATDLESFCAGARVTDTAAASWLGGVLGQRRRDRALRLRASVREADERLRRVGQGSLTPTLRSIARPRRGAGDAEGTTLSTRPMDAGQRRHRAWIGATSLAAVIGAGALAFPHREARRSSVAEAFSLVAMAPQPDGSGAPPAPARPGSVREASSVVGATPASLASDAGGAPVAAVTALAPAMTRAAAAPAHREIPPPAVKRWTGHAEPDSANGPSSAVDRAAADPVGVDPPRTRFRSPGF
jgi:serine/threonine-protein kinase